MAFRYCLKTMKHVITLMLDTMDIEAKKAFIEVLRDDLKPIRP